MRKLRIPLLIGYTVLACLLFPGISLAGGAAGSGAADFLEIPVGARSISLAGATGSLPGDLAAIFRNPALLATDHGHRLHLSHLEWFQGLGHEAALLAFPLPEGWGRTAMHVRYLHLEPIPVFDSDLNEIGDVDVYDMAAGLSWARRFARRWDFGISLHNIRQHLADEEGSGWAWDMGTGFVAKGFYWSAGLRNLGGGVDYGDESFSFDREFNLGAARYLPQLGMTFSCEYRQPRFWGSSFRGGCEYILTERLVLRAGYARTFRLNESSEGQPSFGAGLCLRSIGLDYSFLSHEQLGEVHAISLRLLGPPGRLSPYRFFRPGS